MLSKLFFFHLKFLYRTTIYKISKNGNFLPPLGQLVLLDPKALSSVKQSLEITEIA